MNQKDFWTADVNWDSEPDIEELQRLEKLLGVSPEEALKGLRQLADRGSLAAALWGAMHLDRSNVDGSRSDEVVDWYRRAADLGSRAALYMVGERLAQLGRETEAESAYREGADKNFPPCLYGLACVYIDRRQKSAEDDATIDALLKRATSAGHLFATRDYMTRLLSGRNGVFGFLKGLVLIPVFLARFFGFVVKSLGGADLDERIYG